MADITIILGGIVAALIVANVIVSLFPKRGNNGNIKVAFIPPSPHAPGNSGLESKVDAHISSTNQKITQLFSRMEAIEKKVQSLLGNTTPATEKAWIETVPVRNKKSKKE